MHTLPHPSRPDSLRAVPCRGFTLVELMVTIAVMAILLGVAVPSFNEALLGNKLSSHANSLVASINMARSEAIKRNIRVTLCASADGATCATTGGWEQGWIVQYDADNNSCSAASPNWKAIHRQQAASSGLKISAADSTRTLCFEPTGVGATAATLTVCRATPNAGGQERVVSITATGRASVKKTATGSCS